MGAPRGRPKGSTKNKPPKEKEPPIKKRIINSFSRIAAGTNSEIIRAHSLDEITAIEEFANDIGFEVCHDDYESCPDGELWSAYLVSKPYGYLPAQKAPHWYVDNGEKGPCPGCTWNARCKTERLACGEFKHFVYGGKVSRRVDAAWNMPCKSLYEEIFSGEDDLSEGGSHE